MVRKFLSRNETLCSKNFANFTRLQISHATMKMVVELEIKMNSVCHKKSGITLCQKSRRELEICKFKALCSEYCYFKLVYTSHIVEGSPQ